MSSIGTGYDLSVTTFSPDGRVFQIEYAAKAVDNSGTVVGIRCKDGVVMGVEKLIASKMMLPGSNRRIHSVHRHSGMAVAGLAADGRQIVARAKSEATNYESVYGEPIPGFCRPEQSSSPASSHGQSSLRVALLKPRLLHHSKTFSKPVSGSDEPQHNGWFQSFTIAAYRPYFDVDTSDVLERIGDSLFPFRGSFSEKTASNPDLRHTMLFCLLAVFVGYPSGDFPWVIAGVAGFMSSSFVALNLRIHIKSAGKSWFLIMAALFLLQLALALALKFYLFTVTM
ncbi:Proteasome subunit alpha type-3 [Striga hermonthica]|uniref:Proteasome subunit alpha type n=2 Tax=Eukaryota TaxID=2759 RepID=A0A9N7NW74_STRHE|nr:Proteasome subunit alpha type-3 [Striga hermonthica]